jgi:hypothetical protein
MIACLLRAFFVMATLIDLAGRDDEEEKDQQQQQYSRQRRRRKKGISISCMCNY